MSFLNDFMNTTTVPGAKESVASAIQLAAEIRAGGPAAYAGSWSAAMSQANRRAAEISKDPIGWVSRNVSWDNPNLANQQINYLKQNNYDTRNLDQGQLNTHNLTMQILGQGTTGKWTGEGLGSPEANARAMASTLAGAGITDIKQFGQLPDGSYGNKTTGQPISTNYGRAGGNIFSGTFTGKDSTGFGVQFAPDGTPYFYTQKGASTSSAGDIVPVVSLGLALFAPGIGGAIGSALTGTAATTVASQVIGAAVVQGVLAEAQGGDFLDGAIKGAVTAGVAPAVANTVGASVASALSDSAIKNVVANAVASSASSAVTAALTGGDVGQAALTGALAGAGGSIGREFATAADLGTTPFSEQTQMLAGQEQGLGTAGGLGANIGQAVGAIASGADADQAILQALVQAAAEKQAATPKTVEENISQTPVLAPTETEIAAAPPPETEQIADIGVMDGVAGTIPEITPPSTQEFPIPDQISQELGGVEEGVAGTIPPLDQDIIDLITQPPVTEQNLALDVLGQPLTPEAVDITPVPQENLALDVLGEPLTPEAVDIEPIPQDPLLGLSSPAVGEGEQEAIDYQALEGLSDPSVGFGEEAAIDQANLDALGDLSSAEVGQGEQEAIDRQALEELSSAEVGLGEQEAINQQALEELSSAEVGLSEQEAIDKAIEGIEVVDRPYIRDFYISGGRRRGDTFGPTVTNLSQAISAPFFPSSPVSGLTSYRGAGEIESKSTGKPRRDVWNEASLRLKDALGL